MGTRVPMSASTNVWMGGCVPKGLNILNACWSVQVCGCRKCAQTLGPGWQQVLGPDLPFPCATPQHAEECCVASVLCVSPVQGVQAEPPACARRVPVPPWWRPCVALTPPPTAMSVSCSGLSAASSAVSAYSVVDPVVSAGMRGAFQSVQWMAP